jgi:WD40 repeat protein
MSESLNPFENGPDRDDAKVRLYLPVSPSTPPETQDGSQDISATKSFNAHNTMLSGAAYAPVAAGHLVATISRADRTLHLYDTLTWKRRGAISIAGAPYALAWSPVIPKGFSGSQLAFVDSVGVLSLCAPLCATGDTPATFKLSEMPTVATRVVDAHAGIAYTLAWRMDGVRLATGGGDRNVTIWDPRKSNMTGTQYVARLALAAAVRALSFGPTEATASTLAIGLENGELRFWRTEAEATLTDTVLNHSSAVRSVALDPSGKRLASGTRSGKLFVWLIEGAQCLMNVSVGGVVQALSFSKDGTYLAVGSGANASEPATMSVWSTATLERRADRVADGGWVEALQWHPEGRRETTQHAAAGDSAPVVATKSVHRLLEGVNDGRVREWGITHIDVAMEVSHAVIRGLQNKASGRDVQSGAGWQSERTVWLGVTKMYTSVNPCSTLLYLMRIAWRLVHSHALDYPHCGHVWVDEELLRTSEAVYTPDDRRPQP